MIKLLLFTTLYLADFSHINSLQFTGRGFCAATDGGVFVYDYNEGIVSSFATKWVRLASYDSRSGEIAFITKDGMLFVYSPFFESLKKVGMVGGVVGMRFSAGIIMLLYENGARRYLSKFNQPAPAIYIDTMFLTKPRSLPLYLKTRTYENPCHVFSEPTGYAGGYDLDYVGTKANGVYVFDRRMKKLKKRVYINIEPPVYRLGVVFDTLYVLHAAGVTKISGDYVNSLSTDCFQYGFSPVDFLYIGESVLLLNKNGFYTLSDPYFFTSFDGGCGDAVCAFNTETCNFVATRNCILTVGDDGSVKRYFTSIMPIEYATASFNDIYLIANGKLYTLKDTVLNEVDYENEPILTNYIVQGYSAIYVPAKRGLFIISDKKINLIKSPFNLLSIHNGVASDNSVYLASSNRVVMYDFAYRNWKTFDPGQPDVKGITAMAEFNNRVYIGYNRGVLIK